MQIAHITPDCCETSWSSFISNWCLIGWTRKFKMFRRLYCFWNWNWYGRVSTAEHSAITSARELKACNTNVHWQRKTFTNHLQQYEHTRNWKSCPSQQQFVRPLGWSTTCTCLILLVLCLKRCCLLLSRWCCRWLYQLSNISGGMPGLFHSHDQEG